MNDDNVDCCYIMISVLFFILLPSSATCPLVVSLGDKKSPLGGTVERVSENIVTCACNYCNQRL